MMLTASSTPEELQQALGERLRRLRLRRDLDQLQAAAKAGISEKALRNLEAGRGSTVETFAPSAQGLGGPGGTGRARAAALRQSAGDARPRGKAAESESTAEAA